MPQCYTWKCIEISWEKGAIMFLLLWSKIILWPNNWIILNKTDSWIYLGNLNICDIKSSSTLYDLQHSKCEHTYASLESITRCSSRSGTFIHRYSPRTIQETISAISGYFRAGTPCIKGPINVAVQWSRYNVNTIYNFRVKVITRAEKLTRMR